jgi:hypothetical protein
VSSHFFSRKDCLMGIVMLKRFYVKIPCIGKYTYTTLLKMVQCADFDFYD